MSIVTELIAPPQFVHNRIAQFEQLFLEFASSLPEHAQLRQRLALLTAEMAEVLASLRAVNLDARGTAEIIDRWDLWCEKFEGVSDPDFEEELQDLYIALPS